MKRGVGLMCRTLNQARLTSKQMQAHTSMPSLLLPPPIDGTDTDGTETEGALNDGNLKDGKLNAAAPAPAAAAARFVFAYANRHWCRSSSTINVARPLGLPCPLDVATADLGRIILEELACLHDSLLERINLCPSRGLSDLVLWDGQLCRRSRHSLLDGRKRGLRGSMSFVKRSCLSKLRGMFCRTQLTFFTTGFFAAGLGGAALGMDFFTAAAVSCACNEIARTTDEDH